MNTYRPVPSSNYWMIVLKVIILILGLYLSALILGRVFSWVLAVLFFAIKAVLFIGVSLMVLHFFLKLLFNFNLFRFLFGSHFRR